MNLSEDSFLYNIIGYRFSPEYADTRNARTSEYTDFIYNNFLHSFSFFWGVDSITLTKIDGAGYKVFLMHYGLIGVLITSLFYFLCACKSKSKNTLVLFVVWMLEQYQGSAALWYCVLIGYILSVSNINYLENSFKQYEKDRSILS